jgi:hypothetical protein
MSINVPPPRSIVSLKVSAHAAVSVSAFIFFTFRNHLHRERGRQSEFVTSRCSREEAFSEGYKVAQ